MDGEPQNKQISLLAWCMIYYNSHVSCGRQFSLNNLNNKANTRGGE